MIRSTTPLARCFVFPRPVIVRTVITEQARLAIALRVKIIVTFRIKAPMVLGRPYTLMAVGRLPVVSFALTAPTKLAKILKYGLGIYSLVTTSSLTP